MALGWLVSIKVAAIWLGPEGVGLLTQLRQILQTVTLGATFGGTNLVVQGLADRSSEKDRRRFRMQASRLIGAAGLLWGLIMLATAPQIVWLTLSSRDGNLIIVMRWLALAVMLNVAATYLMAVLNGYRALGSLALAQFSGPFVLALFLIAGWQGKTYDASPVLAAGFVVGFGTALLLALLGVIRLVQENGHEWNAHADVRFRSGEPSLLTFATATTVAALSSVLALLIIRAWIIEFGGLAFAGLFDAGWTLTFNYMTLFLTACNVVYLPALTAANGYEAQRVCILKAAYLVLGGSLILGYGLVAWPEVVIDLFYSPAFNAAKDGLIVLVVAIIVRGVSWVYGTLMLATRSVRAMVVSELMLNIALLVTTKFVLVIGGGLAALGWAFVVPHLLYLFYVIEFVRARNPLMRRLHVWPTVMLGTAPLMLWILMVDTSSPLLRWTAMLTGLLVSTWCFVAYRRVAS